MPETGHSVSRFTELLTDTLGRSTTALSASNQRPCHLLKTAFRVFAAGQAGQPTFIFHEKGRLASNIPPGLALRDSPVVAWIRFRDSGSL